MERYTFNSLSAINLTRGLNMFINMYILYFRVKISYLSIVN